MRFATTSSPNGKVKRQSRRDMIKINSLLWHTPTKPCMILGPFSLNTTPVHMLVRDISQLSSHNKNHYNHRRMQSVHFCDDNLNDLKKVSKKFLENCLQSFCSVQKLRVGRESDMSRTGISWKSPPIVRVKQQLRVQPILIY